jgi:hypothetical protein
MIKAKRRVGRPYISANEASQRRISIRLRSVEVDRLQGWASMLGVTTSEAVRRELQFILADKTKFDKISE